MSNNYQLYRTNRRLTGQVKWDLTIEAHDSHLYVNNLHLSPISKQISTVNNPDENLLGNTHLVNLKSYYKKNMAIFWNPGLNPEVSSCEPMLVPDDYGDSKSLNITPYEESYMMGMSRSKYSHTGKQFEFFCPMWIESYDPKTPLAFKFALRLSSGSQKVTQELVTKFLILKSGDYNNHNKFVSYLDDYFNATKSKDLININLKERTAQIKGIDVETGLPISSIEVPTLATNMLSQERLLMDADELIISSFERNNLIVPQLINFNFVFDAEELITPSLLTAMWGGNIYIDVCAGVMEDGVTFKQFDMMDFYSNYDFIQSKSVGLTVSDKDGDNVKPNIFDALKDHRNLDLMDKNKVSQDIIHWSISGCNDYIFNMYPGFGGYIGTGENIGHITELYQDSPDLWATKYKYTPTCINWCKNICINNVVELEEYVKRIIQGTNEYSYLFDEWSCNTKYTYTSDVFKPIKCCMMVLPKHSLDKIDFAVKNCITIDFNGLGTEKISINEHILVYYNKLYNTVLFLVKDDCLDAAAFRSIRDWAIAYKKNDDEGILFLKEFARWISSVVEPEAYSLKQLGYTQAHGPNKLVSELEHYKVNQTSTIFRYSGKIKPTFVKPDVNNIYMKKLFNRTDAIKQFPKTYRSYKKLYKSIGYYPWESVDLKLNKTNGRDVVLDLPKLPYEYKWYTTSTALLLRSQLSFDINSDDLIGDIESTVIEHLSLIYKVSTDTANYIYKKYDCRVDWEYSDNTSLDKYIYTITLTLK